MASYRPGNSSRSRSSVSGTRVKDQRAAGRGRGTDQYAYFSLSPRTIPTPKVEALAPSRQVTRGAQARSRRAPCASLSRP